MVSPKSQFQRFAACTLVLLIANANSSAAGAKPQSTAQRLEAVEVNLEKASMALDPKPYAEVWADDFVGIAPDGSTYTKAEHMAALKGGHVHFQSITVKPVSTRVYGSAAVLINRRSVKGDFDGKPIDSENLVTNVYVLRAHHWQKVSEHTSRLNQ